MVKAVFYINLCEEHKWPNHYSQLKKGFASGRGIDAKYFLL